MGIPTRTGADIVVVPLTNQWHKRHMPLEANGEIAVPNQWYDGSSVDYVVPNPKLNREVEAKPKQVKARELNPKDFMKGGGLGV